MKSCKLAIFLLSLLTATSVFAFAKPGADPYSGRGVFQTNLKSADLDPAAFAEYVDGQEKKIEVTDEKDKSNSPQWIVWTQDSMPGHSSRKFGDSKKIGPRYLRIGFMEEKEVGSVMVSGNVKVGVLKPDAAYPGNLADDSQWIPAEAMGRTSVLSEDADNDTSLLIWDLPAGTKTRALRFTHVPEESDKSYNGTVGGVYVMSGRFANVAPQAKAISRSMADKVGKVINMNTDGFWGAWENMKMDEQRQRSVAEDPEWIMLVWQDPVTLRGVSFDFPGFKTAEAYAYKGAGSTHPRDAAETDWEKIMDLNDMRSLYPTCLGIFMFDFGKNVTTRAIRLKITEPLNVKGEHPHVNKKTVDGKRIWLGEFMALRDLGTDAVASVVPKVKEENVPTDLLIPVKFTLPEDGYVTLVIEDKTGKRIRNLISETKFPKGDNIAYWDGTNDLGRDADAAYHGLYKIPFEFVEPGDYSVRGLWRKDVKLFYEFGIYNDGNPPWSTDDHTGAWLANHSPPQAAAFVPAAKSPTGEPAMYLGSYVTEGPDGLGWFDLDGRKKGGKKWIGGNWTAAPFLACDTGDKAVAGVYVYAGSVWETGKKSGTNELRITALTNKADAPILNLELEDSSKPYGDHIGGIAARNAVVACSMTKANKILLVDAVGCKVASEIKIDSPKGLAYDPAGRLVAISGKNIVRLDVSAKDGKRDILVSEGLESPSGLTVDNSGNIYVSDHGNSHQVKVFTSDGKFVRAIGKAGAPKAGPYDPLHMNNPDGIAVDSKNHLWVAEADYMPKRVSVWTLEGGLVKAFYGPSKYGGGGMLDSYDKSRFYYADEGKGTMEFELDWEKGMSKLVNILYRRTPDALKMPFRCAAPETAFYRKDGGKTVRYFTNCFSTNPTGGHGTAFLYIERDHVLYPVAGMGRGMDWKDVFDNENFKSSLPEGVDFSEKNKNKNPFFFIWSDLNNDGQVQSSETSTHLAVSGGITVLPDLSFCVARIGEDNKNMQTVRFKPVEFTEAGVPKYDFSKKEILAEKVNGPASSGGDQALVDDKGNAIVTLGIAPFDRLSVCGTKNGVATWSYPNLWPGLHASHHAARPTFPGEIIGVTRLLGEMFTPPNSDAGAMWGVNANMGNMYVFTSDGLFVSTLFEDVRQGKLWKMPIAKRGMDLEGISLHDENFWPTITQTPDGKVYVMSGATTCIVRVEGLDSVRRIPASTLKVTADDLKKAQEYQVAVEALRKQKEGGGVMKVSMDGFTPTMDGKNDDWPSTWVEIDRSGAGANFNSTSKPYDLRGAVAIADGKLFAAWQTTDPKLLKNSGEMPIAPFKTGGCLDLMIGTNPSAKADRTSPVAGDIRLTVTQVKDPSDKKGVAVKTFAVLYRPVAPGTKTEKVAFSSPWRTINFDSVEDISDKVQLVTDGKGNYEISVPLDVLGLVPKPGMRIKGDIGVLRGDGTQTVARTYWSNKSTSIVSDVPSEAELTPGVWGIWEFKSK